MQQMPPNSLQEAQDELTNLMTIMYIMIQQTLGDPLEMASVYTKLRASVRTWFFLIDPVLTVAQLI